MADGRKNNGGHSTKGKAGRKSIHDEKLSIELAKKAIIKTYGSEEAFFEHALKMTKDEKDGFKWFELIMNRAYGKAPQTIDANVNMNGSIEWNEVKKYEPKQDQ